MKKKFVFVFLIMACFVLAGFGGLFQNTAFAEEEASPSVTPTREVVIEGDNALSTFKNLFGNNFNEYADATIILNCDITLTEEDLLTSTLGTETTPFTGTFNGRGHSISGLKIDGGEGDGLVYVGLFGVTDGAVIKNLKLDGNISLKTKPSYASHMGALVGLAKNTTIENVDVDASSLSFNTDFNINLNLGILAGGFSNSSAKNCICRTANSFGTWQITNSSDKEIAFGGVAGKLANSQIYSSVVQTSLSLNVAETFDGLLKVGGIAGQAIDGNTQIINVAEENTISLTNGAGEKVKVGEVVGEISSPSPNQGGYINNISYIHYRDNAHINVFGDKGFYDYDESTQKNCNITANGNNEFNTEEYYTNPALWTAIWDFEHDWYLSGNRIENQAFLPNLQVQLSENLDTEVLTCKSIKINGSTPQEPEFRYGDTVELEFDFAKEEYKKDEVNVFDSKYLIDFYNLRELELASNFNIASSYRGTIEMAEKSIGLSGIEGYSITPNIVGEELTGFTLKIENLSMYSSGKYNFRMEPKTFSANITSRLYKEDGTLIEGIAPGYVYNAIGTPSLKTSWETDMTYKAEYVPEVHTEAVRSYYVFEGWFVDVDGEDENDYCISTQSNSTGSNLKLELGVPYSVGNVSNFILGDVEIYAKYNEQSRQIFFSIDASSKASGVEKIVVIDGKTSQTLLYSDYASAGSDSERSIYINKDSEQIEIEIYVKSGFSFDLDFFAEQNTVQNGYQCEFKGQSVEDNLRKYTFDFTDLAKKDTGTTYESISIVILTKTEDTNNNSLIWIIIGCVGGVVLLALIGLLIFFIVRRRGGSGGRSFRGGKVSKKNAYKSSKKDFKHMYY